MKNRTHTFKGFTLVEIMIVVAIIGLILGVAIPNITSIRKRSRDEKAVAYIGVIEQALAQYRQKCKTYPMHTSNKKLNLDESTGIIGVNNGKCGSSTAPITLRSFLPAETIDFVQQSVANISYTALAQKYANIDRCSTYSLTYSLEGGSSSASLSDRAKITNTNTTGFVECRSNSVQFTFPDPATVTNLYIAPSPNPF